MSRCRSYEIQLIPGVHLTLSLLAPRIPASVTRPSSQYRIAHSSSRASIARPRILSSIAPVLRSQSYRIRDLESVSRRHSLFSPAKYLYPNPFVSLPIPTTITLPLTVTAQPEVPNLHSAVPSLFLLLRGIVVVHRTECSIRNTALSHKTRTFHQLITFKKYPVGSFLKNSQRTLNVVQFHHKLSINSEKNPLGTF
jgi:hypothetical protein